MRFRVGIADKPIQMTLIKTRKIASAILEPICDPYAANECESRDIERVENEAIRMASKWWRVAGHDAEALYQVNRSRRHEDETETPPLPSFFVFVSDEAVDCPITQERYAGLRRVPRQP